MNRSRLKIRILSVAAMLAVVLPVMASCGGTPQPEVTSPTAALPTSAVGAQPTTQPATNEPATSAPEPTTGEAATAVPLQPTQAPDSSLIINPGEPIKTKYLNFGIVNHLFYTDRERVLTLDTIAGFDWVRQQIVWKDVEGPNPGDYAWGELDGIVSDVATHKMRLLVNIVQAPSFYNSTNGLPADPASLGAFVEALVKRYGSNIGAIEIWNEQNLAHENGGRVTEEDAGHYVDILVECYNRIKAVDPNIVVLAGAPSSSGVNDPAIAVSDENYYRAMYRYKDGIIKNHFDAQSVHPGGSANPPETMYPDNPSTANGWTTDPTFYFRHVENVRNFMVQEGVGDHQIWITEFGWATENNTPGYEFGNQVSFEQQSDYVSGAIKYSFDNYRYDDGSPWLGNMFLWNMNFAVIWAQNDPPNPLNEQASFGILNPDYSPRPAFVTLQGLLPQLKQKQER